MPDHLYIYPSYLRRTGSRSEGRRVPASDAVADVTAEEILGAAQRLGYRARIEDSKQYPRTAHRFEGRVRVEKREGAPPKAALLREIAHALRSEPDRAPARGRS
ncbi:MAG: signal recognition particle subunit SRP19/SEC65 family protein [Thermoplasmata archaeon]